MRNRRQFLTGSLAATLGFSAYARSVAAGRGPWTADLGPLVPDEQGLLDLPRDFTYTLLSAVGEEMDDGFLVPALHDGMSCFAGASPEQVVLVRNHEMSAGTGSSAFGREDNALLSKIDPEKVYDAGHGERPARGGTTTVLYNLKEQRVEQHFLSLAGTVRNCAGGSTPWGSWVTCEEHTGRAGDEHEHDHGYAFEVPSGARGLVDPVPLKAMGRFNREAVAVDPASGVVYQTEDRADGLFYRFLPDEPGKLARGGKLQALRFRGTPSLDTRNWSDFTRIPVGEAFEVDWVDVDQPESPGDDLRFQGFLRGAARFARGEGLFAADGVIWFTCTSGGEKGKGQIWRYLPSPHEGQREERRERGMLELFCEPNHPRLLDYPDNICVAPWGDLFVCEDGPGGNRVVGITPDGDLYPVVRNAVSASEFAGGTFSPDGSTFFVNVQGSGWTVAVRGPWERARKG